MEWIQQSGLSESMSVLLIRIFLILMMLLLAFIIDRICRKAVIPIVRKITSKTDFKWDDYLLNDDVLNDCCNLIAPIVIYAAIPMFMLDTPIMEFLMKCCRIYIIAVFMKLLCSIITSLYFPLNILRMKWNIL